MAHYKLTTEALLNWFNGNATIQEVTLGDINEIDISTQSNFPIAHIVHLSTVFNEEYTEFSYQILVLDKYREVVSEKLDILDIMHLVLLDFTRDMYSDSLFDQRVRASTSPTAEVMYDQLQNRLYGWALDLTVKVPNGTRC